MTSLEKRMAKSGATLILHLYAMVKKWRDRGRPCEGDFAWTWPQSFPFAVTTPLVWGTTRARRRRPGPRARYEWVEEHAPVAVCARDRDGNVFCGFRGTSVSRDWDMNAQFHAVRPSYANDSETRVHSGFSSMFTSLKRDLSDRIEKVLPLEETRGIIFCGHSLGGAVATLAAHHFCTRDSSSALDSVEIPRYLTLFGTPRTGNEDFARETEVRISTIQRFENVRDRFPMLPPEKLGPIRFALRHPGTAIPLAEDHGNLFANHSMKTYAQAIGAHPGDGET